MTSSVNRQTVALLDKYENYPHIVWDFFSRGHWTFDAGQSEAVHAHEAHRKLILVNASCFELLKALQPKKKKNPRKSGCNETLTVGSRSRNMCIRVKNVERGGCQSWEFQSPHSLSFTSLNKNLRPPYAIKTTIIVFTVTSNLCRREEQDNAWTFLWDVHCLKFASLHSCVR